MIPKKRGLQTKLFSFREWQRYIECRRTVLSNVHFPTKFKRDPDAPGASHLYLKFLADMRAKGIDREEPVVTTYKHLMPRELTDAMRKIISSLGETTNWVRKDVPIFMPSFTPQYSYLQQLLADYDRDLPSILRTDFHSMNISYATKPKVLRSMAAKCNIDLKITDTSVHFLEKIIPTFEQSNLPSIQEFNKLVKVEKLIDEKPMRGSSSREPSDDLDEYLHRKYEGDLFVDTWKYRSYANFRGASNRDSSTSVVDFGFDWVLPNGRLFVDNSDDSDTEIECSTVGNNREESQRSNDDISTIDFLAKHNASLSNFEEKSLGGIINGNPRRLRRTKLTVERDPVTGKFLPGGARVRLKKAEDLSGIGEREKLSSSENESTTIKESDKENVSYGDNENSVEFENVNGLNSSYDFGLNDDDISILHDASLNSNSSQREDEDDFSRTYDESQTYFRPYGDYWMLRCNFSRVKQKAFRQVERNLPVSFYWLLQECASVVEMSEEDLYEEICLVESYYADVLRPTKSPSSRNRYDHEEYRSKARCNVIRKKW